MQTTKRQLVVALLCGLAVTAIWSAPVFAQTQRALGKPTVFKVTVSRVEMYNGTSWVTVFTGTSQLDLVAAAGTGSFPGISNLTLPAGSYSQVRITFANQFSLNGSLAYGGSTYYVTPTTLNSGTASQASTTASGAGEAAIRNPDWGTLGASVVQTMTIPTVTVSASTNYQPTLKFDITNSLALWEQTGVFFFTLAPVTVTLI